MSWRTLLITCAACGDRTSVLLDHQQPPSQCPVCRSPYPIFELREVMGFIYVLSNPMMPFLLKIGFTERRVDERAAELSAGTGVPAPFVVEAYFPTTNPSIDEAAVHGALAESRVRGREFFSVSIETAMVEIYRACGMRPAYLRSGLVFESPDEQKRRLDMEEAEKAVEEKTNCQIEKEHEELQLEAERRVERQRQAGGGSQQKAVERAAQRLAEEGSVGYRRVETSCPYCHGRLRVPSELGRIRVTCTLCQHVFLWDVNDVG